MPKTRLLPKLVSGGDYSYAYGVVSAKSSKILSEKQMEGLAMFRSIDEVAAFLEGTEYEKDIHEAVGKTADPEKFEKAVLAHFMRLYREITSFIPKADKITLDRIVMGNIETENLEVIIRLVASGADMKNAEKLITPCSWD